MCKGNGDKPRNKVSRVVVCLTLQSAALLTVQLELQPYMIIYQGREILPDRRCAIDSGCDIFYKIGTGEFLLSALGVKGEGWLLFALGSISGPRPSRSLGASRSAMGTSRSALELPFCRY